MTRNVWSKDDGSILPLMFGLVALLMMAAGGVVTLSEIQHERRWLYQLADAAVIAATTSIDVDSYYQGGADSQVPLSHTLARSRINEVVGNKAVTINEVHVHGNRVELTLSREVKLRWGHSRWIAVSVAAKAY
jgi:Flp pilus assembly protein TadG